jgi:small subunit ribosomal protein S5
MLSFRATFSGKTFTAKRLAVCDAIEHIQTRLLSDVKKPQGFRPRRRPARGYRPVKPVTKKARDLIPNNDRKFVTIGNVANPRDELEAEFGPIGAQIFRDMQGEKANAGATDDPIEDQLRMADYLTAEPGSVEDLMVQRRFKMEALTEDEHEQFLEDLDEFVRKGQEVSMMPDDTDYIPPKKSKNEKVTSNLRIGEDQKSDMNEEEPEVRLDPNQHVHGEWSEMLITVGRTTKLWRGGRLESYRALVIGGNTNGCGGFGIGKSWDPVLAVDVAGRNCKKNIFFVDRYQNDGITRDLVGKQNSCIAKVMSRDNGLHGNPLMREILKRFGITNASCKAHGNRNPFNVVRATFKALMTHESLEDIALKRGKRILSLDRAMRMQV